MAPGDGIAKLVLTAALVVGEGIRGAVGKDGCIAGDGIPASWAHTRLVKAGELGSIALPGKGRNEGEKAQVAGTGIANEVTSLASGKKGRSH